MSKRYHKPSSQQTSVSVLFFLILSISFLTVSPAMAKENDPAIRFLLLNKSNCSAKQILKSCEKENISVGKYNSGVWLSDSFEGTHCRTVCGEFESMVVEVNSTVGGFDTAVRDNYTNTPVDDISGPKPVHTSVVVQSVSGEGSWWIGPKISVYQKGTSGLEGNYENYVTENASRTPQEYHDFFIKKGTYLGETEHAGSTYKHYTFAHKTWWQFRAVRQDYRESGTVDIKEILDTWRGYGMPNYELRGIRAGNIETSRDIKAVFVISDIETPDEL